MVDPVWSWCPDCGGLVGEAHTLDLTVMDAALEASRREIAHEREQYPTEWALSA